MSADETAEDYEDGTPAELDEEAEAHVSIGDAHQDNTEEVLGAKLGAVGGVFLGELGWSFTLAELGQAFDLWAERYQANPDEFLEGFAAVDGESYGLRCGRYLVELLEEGLRATDPQAEVTDG